MQRNNFGSTPQSDGHYKSSAVLSECKRYRYQLSRYWGTGPHCIFVGLNPSTADAQREDATSRKCRHFAESWGFSGMTLINLYARRCRYPQALLTTDDPIGPENERWIRLTLDTASDVVAMWGNPGLLSYGDCARQDLVVLKLKSR